MGGGGLDHQPIWIHPQIIIIIIIISMATM